MNMDYSVYRQDEISYKLVMAGNKNSLNVMVIGATGAGKSNTLNAIFQREVAKVGIGVDPETMDVNSYILNDCIKFWDTPGLGDGVEKDVIHAKKLINLLKKTYRENYTKYGVIDLVLIIIESINRDLGTTYKLISEIIIPNLQANRILVAVNQADVGMKGRNWNKRTNTPEIELIKYLEEQAISIQRRIRETIGIEIIKPVYYSALNDYNITKLLDFIIDNMPEERRYMGDVPRPSPSPASSSSEGCFVTTAVCHHLGKSDNCYELTTFRDVRDNWMKKQPGGTDMIQTYYEVAPKIVENINQRPEKEEIYAEIWEFYLKPCLYAIENGDSQQGLETYVKMVKDLHDKYCVGNAKET